MNDRPGPSNAVAEQQRQQLGLPSPINAADIIGANLYVVVPVYLPFHYLMRLCRPPEEFVGAPRMFSFVILVAESHGILISQSSSR